VSPPARGPVRVLVVSSHEVVVTGVLTMLERSRPGWDVVAGPGYARPVDVVLYDVIGLHDGDGSDLDHWVRREETSVIAISRDLRPDLEALALDRGARAAASIGIASSELVDVVECALAGKLDESPFVRRLDADRLLGQEAGLSARESAVLRLIALGHTNQEIADRLYLSINSIKTYIRTTYRKLGVGSRQQAVTWAIQHGFPIERDDAGGRDAPAQSTCSPYISPSGSAISSIRAPSGSVK
jgi:DNA-binding NarL/FixJ family response regulator